MGAKIAATSYYLPKETLTNEDINSEFPEWSVHKIADKTGILNRHIAAKNEFSSDLAISAGKRLFSEHKITPESIDFVLLCTQSPDYFLPTTACLVQKELKIPTHAGALDFNLGCSGYVYGLSLAKGLIMSNAANNVLLITTETYSKYIHPQDKSVKTIFGDAASASLITKSEDGHNQIGNFVFGTDGTGAENLMVKNGASRFPVRAQGEVAEFEDENGNVRSDNCLYMNGSEIFAFTLKSIPVLCYEVLEKNNLSLNDIDLFIFHQANKYMLNALRKKIKIEENKFYICLENTGNTVSSTIPIAIKSAISEQKIRKGNKVMLLGFGVGYSWAGTVVEI